MRYTQSQSPWFHYPKAAAVFTLTTATYLVARTTGWLPGWFSSEKAAKDTDSYSVLTVSSIETFIIPPVTNEDSEDFQLQSSTLADFQIVEPEIPPITKKDSDEKQIQFTSRHLLQQTSLTSTNPRLDQVIQVGQPYRYSLNPIFYGNFSIIGATETNQSNLPSWLKAEYQLVINYPSPFPVNNGFQDVTINGTKVYVVDWDYGLRILDLNMPDNPQLLGGYYTDIGVDDCING
jgi:hypothetical protein